MIGKNNIFNIRASHVRWQGQTGVTRGFVDFSSPFYGVRAWYILMRTYAQKYNCRSIRSIVTRFAPSSENDTQSYIKFCVVRTGFDPDYVFMFNEDYDSLADAMARMEGGVHWPIRNYREVRLQCNILIVPAS